MTWKRKSRLGCLMELNGGILVPLSVASWSIGAKYLDIQPGCVVAKVYAVNTRDCWRMRMLIEPVTEDQNECGSETPINETVVAQSDSHDESYDGGVDLEDTNSRQLSAAYKVQLRTLLQEYKQKGLFPANPKKVAACKGPKLQSRLIDERCRPHADKQRRHLPEEAEMIQSDVKKMSELGTIKRSTSAWAANCVVVRKKDGTARVCQDFRRLNAKLKSDSDGLGDIQSIFDDMDGASCYTSIDLA